MARQGSSTENDRILVADDDAQVRKFFVGELRSAGYTVSEAESGAEVLELLRALHVRVLVLDLDMPETDGFEILKVVRTGYPHIRVVVVSGYMQGTLLKAAELFGAALTLEKPVAAEDLLENVRKLLGETE